DFVNTRNKRASLVALVSMIKNGIPVSEEMIDDYAKVPSQQIALYDELLKIGKASFFKGQYASQKSFARAFTLMYFDIPLPVNADLYYDIEAIKDTLVNGRMLRYYIFNITCQS